jgi:hypothetical protein
MGESRAACTQTDRRDQGGEMNALITIIELLIIAVWAGVFYLAYRIVR